MGRRDQMEFVPAQGHPAFPPGGADADGAAVRHGTRSRRKYKCPRQVTHQAAPGCAGARRSGTAWEKMGIGEKDLQFLAGAVGCSLSEMSSALSLGFSIMKAVLGHTRRRISRGARLDDMLANRNRQGR